MDMKPRWNTSAGTIIMLDSQRIIMAGSRPMSGISVTHDFLARLWKGCLQVGARPDITNTVNTVPVTQVSRIAVAAALHLPTATGQTLGVAQVTSHPRLRLNEWIGSLEPYRN
ncbi:hypothetical protein F5B21DRAFT_503521 [Xylaria acuta]|nr:hypothetical protein F5B21DRAFT_503521 [Xylaria acuta]